MKYHALSALVVLIGCNSVSSIGCSYEPPQVTGSNGAGGSSSSASSGQGGSAGQPGTGGQGTGGQGTGGQGTGGQAGAGECVDPMPTCDPYTGPAGTDGMGTCRGSTAKCQNDGKWSACGTQVIPTAEGCTSSKDINCDGFAPCTGKTVATLPPKGLQSNREDIIIAMASGKGDNGRDGPIYAVGFRDGVKPLTPGYKEQQVLVWKRNQDGTIEDLSTAFKYSGGAGAVATAVTVLPSGEVLVVGTVADGNLSVDNMPIDATGTRLSFWVILSADGKVISAQSTPLNINALTSDSTGNIYFAGSYVGAPMIATHVLPNAGDQDGFVASVTSGGTYRWHQTFKGDASPSVEAIALIDDGDVVVATTFTGPLTLNNPSIPNPADAGWQPDILLTRLNKDNGLAKWHVQVPGSAINGNMEVAGLAATPTQVAFGGRFKGDVNVLGTDYFNAEVGNNVDSFVAMVSSDGSPIKEFASQAPGTQELRALAFDSFGDLVLAGSFSGGFPLPVVPVQSSAANGTDAFVAKVNSSLNGHWSQKFGDVDTQSATALVIGDSTGHVFAGGGFKGTLSGGLPELVSAGGFDGFILELGD